MIGFVDEVVTTQFTVGFKETISTEMLVSIPSRVAHPSRIGLKAVMMMTRLRVALIVILL